MNGPALAILAAALALSAWLLPGRVYAHGDADWIQRGGYRNPVTNEFCCGRADCEIVPAERVLLRGDGRYEIDGATIPFGQVLPSENEHWWVCWRGVAIYPLHRTRSVRCLFQPLAG